MKNAKKLMPLIYIGVFLLSVVVYNLMPLYYEMNQLMGRTDGKMIQVLMVNTAFNFGASFLIPYFFKKVYYAIPAITLLAFIPTIYLFYGGLGFVFWILYICAAVTGTLAAKGYLFKEKTGAV